MHPSVKDTDVYYCKTCNFSTQHQDKLNIHVQDQHSQQSRIFYSAAIKRSPVHEKKSPAQSYSDDFLNCNLCEFRTKLIKDLKTHKDAHVKHGKKSKHPFTATGTFKDEAHMSQKNAFE